MKKDKLSIYFTKILLSIIFILISIIYIRYSNNNKDIYESLFLKDSMSFSYINNIYNKYFGSIIPIKEDSISVINTTNYDKMDNYLNGKIIYLDPNSSVLSLSSGVIVFMGEKEGYGNTIIVQGNDGVDIWYGNIAKTNYNIYDYVKENDIIGSTKDNLYIVLMKDNNYIDYETYKV